MVGWMAGCTAGAIDRSTRSNDRFQTHPVIGYNRWAAAILGNHRTRGDRPRGTADELQFGWHRQVIWECLWRSRCEWTGWQKIVADCVFQAAAAVMIWFQTAKRLVISVRHSGALIR